MSPAVPLALDFAIIGAQKSGSTALHAHLASHRGVWMPRGEQPHLEDPYYSDSAVADLREQLAGAPAGARIGIKRPDYLAHREVPARLHALAPSARLIVALRNPVARAVSAFYHYRHYGLVPDTDPSTGLRNILRGDVPARYRRAREVVEFGLYGNHLRRWSAFFPPSQILVVQTDDLRVDTGATLRHAEEFLGLAPQQPAASPPANPGPYSAVRRTYMRLVRSLVGVSPTDGATGLVESRFGRRAMAFDDGWLAQRFRGRPAPLDDDVRDELARFYSEDDVDLAPFATPS